MFQEYFGFRENPFSETHNVDFFYLNNSNKQLYRDLLNDTYRRVALTLLLADWGVGKTAFLQQLIGIDPFELMVLYFHDTNRWQDLIDFLCNEMALSTGSLDSKGKKQLLTEHLSEKHQGGIIPVLIVDNTQELEDDALASLLQLSGQRIEGQPLIQVILATVPAFVARFELPALEPYKSTISRHYQLNALKSSEVNEYIYFRLQQVGFTRKDLFSESAMKIIADRSEGIPWLINKLCGSALLLASLEDYQTVDEEIVKRAAGYCFLNPDSIENDTSDGVFTINDISDTKTSNLSQTRSDKDDHLENTPATKQYFRFTSIAVLALLLAGTIIWLISNPEQRLKEETDAALSVAQSTNLDEETDTTTPSLVKNAIRDLDTVEPKDHSKATVAPALNPTLANTKPKPLQSQKPDVTDVLVATELQEEIEQKPSPKHLAKPKKIATLTEQIIIPDPANLDDRERLAKSRALARLKLKQSNINFGIDAFMAAARTADNKILELLLAGGVPIDIQEQTHGSTALALAASNGHSLTAQLLLSQQASIDLRDYEGRTALMAAAGNGHTKTLRILLNNGAKIDITDHDAWTALMFAAYSNRLEAVQILLDHGANKHLKNSVGRTALQIARNRGAQDVIALFSKGVGSK